MKRIDLSPARGGELPQRRAPDFRDMDPVQKWMIGLAVAFLSSVLLAGIAAMLWAAAWLLASMPSI